MRIEVDRELECVYGELEAGLLKIGEFHLFQSIGGGALDENERFLFSCHFHYQVVNFLSAFNRKFKRTLEVELVEPNKGTVGSR